MVGGYAEIVSTICSMTTVISFTFSKAFRRLLRRPLPRQRPLARFGARGVRGGEEGGGVGADEVGARAVGVLDIVHIQMIDLLFIQRYFYGDEC